MKKMTFALACASTLALFADLPNTIGFEDYTAPFQGLSGKTDAGVDNGPTSSFWLSLGTNGSAGTADNSAVKAYGNGNLEAPTTGDAAGNNYLELSTEGDTLWRSINTLASATELGAAQEVSAETGLYVDTMVQFTPTEDGGAPELGGDDKLAIWLNVTAGENGAPSTTNLCVCAQFLNYVDDVVSEAATFTLEPVEGTLAFDDASAWHRLTVKAYTLLDDENQRVSAFEIKVDDKAMKATTSPIGAGMQEMWADLLTDGQKALVEADRLFPSLEGIADAGSTFTLQAVGFKGSGAIDNLSITAEDPTPAPVVKVDLTISAENATVSGIAAGEVEVGSNLTFTVTANTGYNVTAVTINGNTVTADGDNYTYTVADTDEAVAVVVTTEAIPSIDWDHPDTSAGTTAGDMFKLTGPIAAADGVKVATWAKAKGVDFADASTTIKMDAFLLNCANTDDAITAAKAAFKIVSIEQDEDGAWVAKVTDDTGDGEAYGNGYVVIKGAATVDAAEYDLETTDSTAKFFKAFLVLEAPTAK